ncbi:MAG: protein TolR [Candidatus Binatia bacterium]|nr:MAG: protein TolR [Candidatus Binatia bacterium]
MAFERSNGSEISQINVTPLVDVMLVLLVIFMVTAPILQQGVAVNLPDVRGEGFSGEEVQLVVTVDRDGALYLNDVRMDEKELQKKLAAVLRERPDKQVFLRADEDARYGEVARAMAAVREAGVRRIGMVTEPPVEGG